MPAEFKFDIFLSHSSKDKAVVRELAARLKKDGVRVWLDEEQIKPGDSIPAKIEEGLEHSRVLVLCMSANAFGSDWAQLESGTFRFRDPLNKERRFIPLRLDDAPIKGSLAQFLYINWLSADLEQEYAKLLESCRQIHVEKSQKQLEQFAEKVVRLKKANHSINAYSFNLEKGRILTGSADNILRLWDLDNGRCLTSLGIKGWGINNVMLTADRRRAFCCSENDSILRLWNFNLEQCVKEFTGHNGAVWSISLSPDERRVLSGAEDEDVRLWDVKTSGCIHTFKGHRSTIYAICWSSDQRTIASGSGDNTVRLWNVDTAICSQIFYGHGELIHACAFSPDNHRIASGSDDCTIRLWDVKSGRCLRILEGHRSAVLCLAWNPDGRFLISGSLDNTVRLWSMQKGICVGILVGHSGSIWSVRWAADGCRAYSGDENGEIRTWDLSEFVTSSPKETRRIQFPALALQEIKYTNAKVLLVGESGVGKTGLSNYLAHSIKVVDDKPLPSTDGAWATHWPLKHDNQKAGMEREIWLWDFAGQVDYRLVHQLHMDDAAAAVVVFDPQKENLFEGLGQWDRDIQKATGKSLAKLLVAGRVDRGSLVVSDASMKKFMKERGFVGSLHETSAKTGAGCDQLREAIVLAIDWKTIPKTTSPALYHRLKQEILSLRDSGFVLIRLAELKQRMELTLRGENFELAELEAVVSLLAGPGMIQRLDFGGFILLRPEVLSRYAAAAVRKVRKHPQELGCIREEELLAGDLDYQDFKRLPREDEAVVLRTLLETFISRAWCLRQSCDGSAMLTFPSYFRRERQEQPSHPSVLVTYRFDGPADDIYATLVVRLHHTVAFNQGTELWKSAADFKTQIGAKLGFTLLRDNEGTSRLEVYFEPNVDGNSRVLFLRYIHDHLMQQAQNVVRLRRYYCADKTCDGAKEPFPDQAKIDKALAPGGKGKVFCPDCGEPIVLRDVIEEKFDSPKVKEQSREMDSEAQAVLDNESRELMALHHTGFTVAEAGQIFRPTPNSDWGIDGEIEFKDNSGNASGKRLYVQLKSGDSYLKKRQSDGAEVFQIKNPRWADYWQQQAYAVMLVIRTSDGEIRWMDVSAYLKRESASGKTVKQIVFVGERFDAVSVQNWRKKLLL
jgi:WD40 repeat protein